MDVDIILQDYSKEETKAAEIPALFGTSLYFNITSGGEDGLSQLGESAERGDDMPENVEKKSLIKRHRTRWQQDLNCRGKKH